MAPAPALVELMLARIHTFTQAPPQSHDETQAAAAAVAATDPSDATEQRPAAYASHSTFSSFFSSFLAFFYSVAVFLAGSISGGPQVSETQCVL